MSANPRKALPASLRVCDHKLCCYLNIVDWRRAPAFAAMIAAAAPITTSAPTDEAMNTIDHVPENCPDLAACVAEDGSAEAAATSMGPVLHTVNACRLHHDLARFASLRGLVRFPDDMAIAIDDPPPPGPSTPEFPVLARCCQVTVRLPRRCS